MKIAEKVVVLLILSHNSIGHGEERTGVEHKEVERRGLRA